MTEAMYDLNELPANHRMDGKFDEDDPTERLLPYLDNQIPGAISLQDIIEVCFDASVANGWWHDVETGKPLERNKGEMIALIHTEISEAMEGERKDLMDDKLPHRKMAEVELADAVVRIFDYAKGHGYDLPGAVMEKLRYNATRADHKPENRRKANGKKF